jgi:uncharacterized membrane protein
MRILTSMKRLEDNHALDGPAAGLRALGGLVPEGAVRDALRGDPVGHPIHPALVQIPVGAWVSATLLDFVPRTGPASTVLIAVGLGTVLPAAAAGAVDLAAMTKEQQRVGVAHVACNSVGIVLFGASLVSRLRSRHLRGRGYALAGLAAVGLGGLLGGHLAFQQPEESAEEVEPRYAVEGTMT